MGKAIAAPCLALIYRNLMCFVKSDLHTCGIRSGQVYGTGPLVIFHYLINDIMGGLIDILPGKLEPDTISIVLHIKLHEYFYWYLYFKDRSD